MRKKYIVRFLFHDLEESCSPNGQETALSYDTYEEALEDAKFYFEVFFEAIWRRLIIDQGLLLTVEEILKETSKIASQFALLPNESNFDFYEYAKSRDSYYRFKKSIENSIFR